MTFMPMPDPEHTVFRQSPLYSADFAGAFSDLLSVAAAASGPQAPSE